MKQLNFILLSVLVIFTSNFTRAEIKHKNADVVIITQPISQISVCPGNKAFLFVKAASINAISYQWLKNGENILGATKDTLTFDSISAKDTGIYQVLVFTLTSMILSSSSSIKFQLAEIIKPEKDYAIISQNVYSANFRFNTSEKLNYDILLDDIPVKSGTTSIGENNLFYNVNGSGVLYLRIKGNCGFYFKSYKFYVSYLANYSYGSNIVCPGATFSPKISLYTSTSEDNFYWIKNGQRMMKNKLNFSITETQLTDYGLYSIEVETKAGSVYQSLGYFSLPEFGYLTETAGSVIIYPSQSTNFYVSSSGALINTNYQWYKNGFILNDITNHIYGSKKSSLDFMNVTINDTGSYFLKINNSKCAYIISDEFSLILVTQQPQSKTFCQGDSIVFIIHTSNDKKIQFQWYKNNIPIIGAINPELHILNANVNDTGQYQVQMFLEGKSFNSDLVYAHIQSPFISNQIKNKLVLLNEKVFDSLIVNNWDPFQFQWFNLSSIKTLGNGLTFQIPQVTFQDTGLYQAKINASANCPDIFSNKFRIDISNLKWDSIPTTINLCKGNVLRLEAKAPKSTVPVHFNWFKNGIPLNQDSFVLYKQQVDWNDTGNYQVYVSDGVSSDLSTTFKVKIIGAVDEINPGNMMVLEGNESKLFCSARSTQFIYSKQIIFNGNLLINNTNESYFNDTLFIKNFSIKNNGNYQIQANTSCGVFKSKIFNLKWIKPFNKPTVYCIGNKYKMGFFSTDLFSIDSINRYKNDSLISKSITNTLSIPISKLSDAGIYKTQIWSFGNSYNFIDTIYINDSIVFDSQLKSTYLTMSTQNFQLNPILKNASLAKLNYQWYQSGTLKLVSNFTSVLNLNSININDSGMYLLQLPNGCWSDTFYISIYKSERNIIHYCPQSNITLAMIVNSNNNPTFQWYKFNQLLPNQSNKELNLNILPQPLSGLYSVKINVLNDSVIIDNLQITQRPSILSYYGYSVSKYLAYYNQPYTISYHFNSTIDKLDWYFNGKLISSENDSSLTIKQFKIEDVGKYYAIAYQSCKQISLDTIKIDLCDMQISSQPTNIHLSKLGTNNLKFIVQNTCNVTNYQWYRNDTLLPTEQMQELWVKNVSDFELHSKYFCSITDGFKIIKSNSVGFILDSFPNGGPTLIKLNAHVYPNPFDKFISLQFPIPLNSFKIIDLQSKTVFETNQFSADQKIELPDLKDGFYILQFIDRKGNIYNQKGLKKTE